MQTVDFVCLDGFEIKHEVLKSEVVNSFRTIRFNILLLFCFQKLSFAECRSKMANLYSVWHIVSCIAQRQNVVIFHKLVYS